MSYQIDATDRRILQFLQEDGKMTIKELAKELNMTNTPIFERIKKLEAGGFIKKYTAVLDFQKLNYDHVVFCFVSLERHHKEFLLQFINDVKNLPQVMECYHIAGLHDYLLKVVVRDMEEYHHFIANELASLPNIGRVQSSFVMSTIKNELSIPLI